MQYKMLALTLALAAISWAQTATPTTPSTPQAGNSRAQCACREKMARADGNDAQRCCARPGARNTGAQEMASRCSGKEGASGCSDQDAKSSTKPGKDKCRSDGGPGEMAKTCCGSHCRKQCADRRCCGARSLEKAASDLLASNFEHSD